MVMEPRYANLLPPALRYCVAPGRAGCRGSKPAPDAYAKPGMAEGAPSRIYTTMPTNDKVPNYARDAAMTWRGMALVLNQNEGA